MTVQFRDTDVSAIFMDHLNGQLHRRSIRKPIDFTKDSLDTIDHLVGSWYQNLQHTQEDMFFRMWTKQVVDHFEMNIEITVDLLISTFQTLLRTTSRQRKRSHPSLPARSRKRCKLPMDE